MKKLVIVLALLAMAIPAFAVPADVVISQLYGGGGNSGGIYNQDFVELFNRTSHWINISGWSLQYGSATGTSLGSSTTNVAVIPEGAWILPCSYYLVGLSFGSTTTLPPLPTVDATGPIMVSGTTGKMALLSVSTSPTPCTSTDIVDILGWGSTANCYETAPAGGTTNPTGVIRNAGVPGGIVDTDNNSLDFTVGTPLAHNSASGPNSACQGDPVANESQTWGSIKALYR